MYCYYSNKMTSFINDNIGLANDDSFLRLFDSTETDIFRREEQRTRMTTISEDIVDSDDEEMEFSTMGNQVILKFSLVLRGSLFD
jgi:hypothetical protein